MSDTGYERLPETLRLLRTRPLFVMRLEVLGPSDIGMKPDVGRRVGFVTGGTFEGERLAGQVLAGGSDWQIARADDSLLLDVRIVLRTVDGALIAMTYRGIRHQPPPPSDVYFRINPLFETSEERYAWLNRTLAIGIGESGREGSLYSIFEVL